MILTNKSLCLRYVENCLKGWADICQPDTCQPDTCQPDTCQLDTCQPDICQPGHLPTRTLANLNKSDICQPKFYYKKICLNHI